MIRQSVVEFFAGNQEALWLFTLAVDLGGTVILYRLFGKAGLQVAIATALILANLHGPKLTVIFGMQTSLGVIHEFAGTRHRGLLTGRLVGYCRP